MKEEPVGATHLSLYFIEHYCTTSKLVNNYKYPILIVYIQIFTVSVIPHKFYQFGHPFMQVFILSHKLIMSLQLRGMGNHPLCI